MAFTQAVLATLNTMANVSTNATSNSSSRSSSLLSNGCGAKVEMDPELLILVRFIINEVCVPILVPFGVLANSLNVIVLTRKWMRSSTNCYLTTLAVYDSLFLLFAFVMAFSAYPSIRYEQWYVELRRFVQPMTNVFSNTAVWIVVAFSCERYVAISFPIKGRRWCTISKAKRIIASICVVCFLVTAPELFCTKVVQSFCANVTSYRLAGNDFHEALNSHGYYYFNSTVFAYVPLFLLTVFNVLLIRAIIRSRQLRKSMIAARDATSGHYVPRQGDSSHRNNNATGNTACSEFEGRNSGCNELNGNGNGNGNDALDRESSGKSNPNARRKSKAGLLSATISAQQKREKGISEQNRLTLMLVIVVVAFLFCHLPSAIGTTIQSYVLYNPRLRLILRDGLKIYGNVCNLLVQLNTASNFILYSMLSTKFRMTFRKIFCKCMLSDQDSKTLSDGRAASLYTSKTVCESTTTNERRQVMRLASVNELVTE